MGSGCKLMLVMCRLDAGTFGTMGVGLGFAIAAAAVERSENRNQRIVCVEGDSAFGFSGMEVETMCRWVGFLSFYPTYLIHFNTPLLLNCILSVLFYRYNLPVVIIVVNNNGIYSGVDPETWKEMEKMGDLTTM